MTDKPPRERASARRRRPRDHADILDRAARQVRVDGLLVT